MSNTAPVFSLNASSGAPSFTQNGSAVVLGSEARIFDAELAASGSYAGARLLLVRHGGTSAEDTFYATGDLGVLNEGGNLVYAGATIGTVITNSGGTLEFSFNSNATQPRVDATLASLAYSNTSDLPPATVQIDWNFTDGNTGEQGTGGARTASGVTTVNITPVEDVLGTTDTTSEVTIGVVVKGAINATGDVEGDQDWYRVALIAGHQYLFELKGAASSSGSLADPYLRLLDSSGAQLASDDDSGIGTNAHIAYTPTQSAFYLLSAQAFSTNVGSFELSAAEASAGTGDVLGSTSTTSTLAIGNSVTGTVDPAGYQTVVEDPFAPPPAPGVNPGADQDWYRVELVAGHRYRFDLQGAASGHGSLADPYLRLLDASGTPLAYNDDAGSTRESSITYTANLSGIYYLSAQGFGSNVGTFTLGASELSEGAGDVLGSTSTTGVLSVGSAINGTIEPSAEQDPFAPPPAPGAPVANLAGDEDWYQVALEAGHRYRFDLQGAASNHGSLIDPYLRLLDGAGVQLAFNDDAGGTRESSIVYAAGQTGILYLSAQGFASSFGSFTLTATDLGSSTEDVSASIASTSTAAVDDVVTGTIDAVGDEDWYRLTLIAGHQYLFDLQGAASNRGSLVDSVLRLRDSAGVQIAYNDDAGGTLESSIAFTPDQAGTYFLAAQGYSLNTGTFTLGVSDVTGGVGDVPATLGTGSAVAVGGSVTSTIDSGGDQDWYQVVLLAGHQYRFDLQGASSNHGSLIDPYLRLLDSAGVAIASNDNSGSGRDSSITYTPSSDGAYLLSAQGFSSSTGTYALGATDLSNGAADVLGNAGTSSALFMGGAIAGAIDTLGDADWYRVSLVAGHGYRFELTGFDSGTGTLGDPSLSLLDSAGVAIASDDDSGHGLESLISFSATQTGDYFLSAQSFAGAGTGTFSIQAIDASADVAASPGTRSSATMGGTVIGTIDADGDLDWYRLELVAGHRYAFDLQGAASGSGTLADPLLQLLDASGAEIALDDDSGIGTDSSVAFLASQSGSYFLVARSYSSAPGTYALSAVDFDDLGDVLGSSGTSTSISMNSSLTGTIDTGGDADWYRVSLVAGREYRFDLQGADSNLGSLADPYLRLIDASGAEITADDDAGTGLDASITYTPLSSSYYFISAQAYASSNGAYTLSATDLAADAGDVPGDASTATLALVGDSIAGTIEPAGDQDWYRVSLVAGSHYRFDLQGEPTSHGSLTNPNLRLLDSSGVQLASDDDSGLGLEASIAFTPAQTGTYYLSAQGGASAAGSFVLYAADTDSDVPGNRGSNAVAPVGGAIAGTLDASGDKDWYRVALYAGHSYQFDLKGAATGHGSLGDPYLRLLDDAGVQIAADDDAGEGADASLSYVPIRSGNYLLSAGSFLPEAGTYTLNATDLSAADVPANTSSPNLLSSEGLLTGVIDAGGDQDWYRVPLVAGHQYRFDLQGADSGQGSLADPYLSLLDGAGVRIASDDNTGTGADSSITYTASLSGNYFVSAQGVSSSVGTFTLSATDFAASAVEVPGSVATSGAVAVGGSIAGTIDTTADQDWYQVSLIDGHRYRFDLQGAATSHGTLVDPYLRLIDGAGVQLASDDDSGTGPESSIAYSANQTGIYFLSAQGYSTSAGSFTLSATDLTGSTLPQVGTTGDDVMLGTEYDDHLQGLAGADQLDGKGGSDWLGGGAGNDTLGGGSSDDTLIGGEGDDQFLQSSWATGGNDSLAGGAGNDDLGDSLGRNVLDGGAGDDHFTVFIADAGGSNIAGGGLGQDTYEILPRNAAFSGLAYLILDFEVGIGGDLLDVRELVAASSRERYFVAGSSSSADFLRLLPSGSDALLQWDRDGVSGSAYDWVTQLTLKSIDASKLTADNYLGDVDVGSKSADSFLGGPGNDTLLGAYGNDTLSGGVGADLLVGGAGADLYYVDDPKDVVIETDNVPSDASDPFKSSLDLGSIVDIVISSISYTLSNYVEQLALAGNSSDRIATGNTLDNVLTDHDGANTLAGLDGADILDGGAGDDTLDGGPGADSALFSGLRADYAIARTADGYSITDSYGGDGDEGSDVLTGIERLVFADIVEILGTDVHINAYHWKSHNLLGGVSISASSHSGATDNSGGALFGGVTYSPLTLSVTRAVAAEEAAITSTAVNLQDAIAILKLIVGLEVNGASHALSPYQALAADFDGNGKVQLTDAIGVLKHVVGLSAPDPAWHFASEADSAIPQLSALSPGAAPAIDIDLSAASSPVHVGLVAYVSGDVDGSYAGIAGSLDLDETQPDYFSNLTQSQGLDPAQFGIYV